MNRIKRFALIMVAVVMTVFTSAPVFANVMNNTVFSPPKENSGDATVKSGREIEERITVTSLGRQEDSVSYRVEISDGEMGRLLSAVYDNTGKLLTLKNQAAAKEQIITFTLPEYLEGGMVQFFLWDTVNTMVPLAAAAKEELDQPVPESTITLDYHTYPLYVGNASITDFSQWDGYGSSFTLTASVASKKYTENDIKWTINDDIASLKSINKNTVEIRARRTGVATAIAHLPDGSRASCYIPVIDNASRLTVEKLSFNADALTLPKGQTAELKTIVYPKDIYNLEILNSTVTWSSSDSSVASVKDGAVTAARAGKAVITATSKDVGRTAQCTVTVTEEGAISEITPVQTEMIEMTVGEQTTLEAGTDSAIIWKSDNSYIADVNQNGVVTAYSNSNVQNVSKDGFTVTETAGTVKIYATAENGGRIAEYEIRVADSNVADEYLQPSNGVFGQEKYIASKKTENLSIEARDIDVDQMIQIITVADGDSKLLWLCSSLNTATLDREGNVKGYKPGTVTIYAITEDSLTASQIEKIKELQEKRELGENTELNEILAHAVYARGELTVHNSSQYLRNVHVVPETVTDHSVNILWNRAALNHIPDFKEYRIYVNGEELDTTTMLGYTANHLEASTEYRFQISAVDTSGTEVESYEVTAKTKAAPAAILNVLDYGAKGDGSVMDTYAIQKAINDCPENGVVYLPEGHVFYCGALFLKSNMTFQVDGIILGSIDPKDYPRWVTKWEGWRKTEQSAVEWANSTSVLAENHMPHASLINAGTYDEGVWGTTGPYHVENLVICGKGQINANGFALGFNEGPNATYASEPWTSYDYPVKDQSQRGRAITVQNGRNIYIKDITVAYSPSWTVHTINCDHITFDNMDVISQGNGNVGKGTALKSCGHIPNGDGIDPESCTNVNLFHIEFGTGDDTVAMKTGRNKEGNLLDKPNAYVRITDCTTRWSLGGFGTGSENAGGAHDLLFQNLTIDNVRFYGIWLKTRPERGGVTQDVQIKDMNVKVANAAVSLSHSYSDNANPGNTVNPADTKPVLRYVTIENVKSEGNSNGILCNGLEESLIHDVTIKNCEFKQQVPSKLEYCSDFNILDVENTAWSWSKSSNISVVFTRVQEDTSIKTTDYHFWVQFIEDNRITAIENITGNMLLAELQSSEGGEQKYILTDGDGKEITDMDAPLPAGCILTVMSPDESHTKDYSIQLKQSDITQLSIKTKDGKTLLQTALLPESTIEDIRTDANEVIFDVTSNDPAAQITVTTNGAQVSGEAMLIKGNNHIEIAVNSSGSVKEYGFNIDASYLIAENFTGITDAWGFSGSGGAAVSDGSMLLLTSKQTDDTVTKILGNTIPEKKKMDVSFEWKSNAASGKGNGSWFALHDSEDNIIFALYGNGKYVGIGASTTNTTNGWETIESFSNDWYRVELTLDFEKKIINGTITNITDNKIVKTYTNEPMANNARNLGKLYAHDGWSDAVISLDNVFVKETE